VNTLTLALVVVIAAIAISFSTEFGKQIKKILAIPGMKLALPLLVASYLVVTYDVPLYFFLLHLSNALAAFALQLASWLPFRWEAGKIAVVILLMAFSFLPVLAINYWFTKKSYQAFQYSYFLNTILWMFIAVLFLLK
jgi:hypothetical protein